ncbi:MAG: ATP-dependent RNA helicase HrpA [Thalassolituus sp.]
MIPEAEKALQHCLLRDRFPLRAALKRADSMADAKRVSELATILQRIERSQAIVGQRSQPLPVKYPAGLPVSERREEILALIKDHQVVVIAGETGSGKTTQLPKMCIEAGLGIYGRIGHTQPRRLAARAVAQRIADELQTPLGEQVGFQVRFTDQSSDKTRIKVMTDGILLAQTQRDRFLNEYDCIIIDEAHERSLNIDFLLGYLKQLLPKRPDLKVIITSATIDVERFSQHFDNAPVIEVSGRTFPVEVLYRPLVRTDAEEEDRSMYEGVAEALYELVQVDRQKGSPGDTLVFLPGEREIRECADYLRHQNLKATDILPLYARLSAADQQKIFRPHGGRRVVLSTNVAETSLTVPGIRYVIDAGVARISRYSYRTKVQRLPVEPISQASANQRAGRCGRIEPGVCIRLYEEQDFNSRPEFTDPEIRRTNLASVVLQMLNLKLGDIRRFPFVDPPDDRFVKDGYTLLSELGAVDGDRKITDIGQTMARLPVDPRIGRMLIEADRRKCTAEMMIIASALTVADPRERPQEKQQAAAEKHRQWADDESDFATLINLWNGFEEERQQQTQNQLRKWCKKNYLSYMRMREWRDSHRQLHILLRDLKITVNETASSYEALHKALLAGMLSHVGFRAEGKEFNGARNRKFILAPNSAGYKKPPKWIMAAELVETSKLFARMVARIEPEWLEELGHDLLKYQYFEPHWHIKRGQVVAFQQSSLYGLVVNPRKRVDYSKTHREEAREVFITEALVGQKLESGVDFYKKNCGLIEAVTEYEEKSRRRDLVIDDQALIDFYEAALPEEAMSRRDLEVWFKRADKEEKDRLYLTREFLLSDAARGISSVDYPADIEINGVAFPLSYTFAPGSRDDGVTLSVPAPMLAQINERLTEWLVPGFIHNKVVAIIKGLPKPVRKQFVPVPDTAEAFLKSASPDNGGLYIQLADYLNRTLRPARITPEELSAIELEDHLKMNFQVMAGKQVLAVGRNLAELKDNVEVDTDTGETILLDDRFDGREVNGWSFGTLPETTEAEVAGLPVRAYPCLKEENGSVVLTVENQQEKAEQSHRQGALALLRQQLAGLDRELRQEVQKQMKPHWLLAKGMGSEAELQRDLVEACYTHVLLPLDQPLPRTEAEFDQRLAMRSELFPHLEALVAQFIEWLKIRHRVLKSLRGAVTMDKAMAFSDTKAHLERLLHSGFMAATTWERLKSFTRYLKGMEYRIEKLQGNLPRDRVAMTEFESLYAPWGEAVKRDEPEKRAALEEFRWLLEEWRVSLFAQPLGTQEPVSLKRLNKRWQEIVSGIQ